MNLGKTYLALAIAGALVPFFFLAQHFKSVGFGLSGLLAAVFENPAASGFTSAVGTSATPWRWQPYSATMSTT